MLPGQSSDRELPPRKILVRLSYRWGCDRPPSPGSVRQGICPHSQSQIVNGKQERFSSSRYKSE